MHILLKSGCLVLILFLSHNLLGAELTVKLPNEVDITFVKVPAGTFMMGSPEGERGNNLGNETQHEVTLTQDYYLTKTEVTQEQWQAVMGTPMSSECGNAAIGDEYPVYCVTWDRIAGPGGFMEKLNELLGSDTFRLPTEAEWEHAARAGTTTRFSHGDVLECGDDCEACEEHDLYMWWCGNVSPFGPSAVGQKLPNAFGLHDMHGNLWEIVNDRYGEFSTDPVTDPTGPGGMGDIVIRGGGREAWINRSASRVSSAPDDRAQNDEVGFRIAAGNLEGLAFSINAGLNDAWYNPATDGQGFLITALPVIERMFVAWFTFDTERPPLDTPSGVGEPGHRWLIAQGPYSGDTATMTIFVSKGGVFDSVSPEATTDPAGDGTLTIEFADCSNALVTYDITSAGLSGEIPIERIADDNVALCESLSTQ